MRAVVAAGGTCSPAFFRETIEKMQGPLFLVGADSGCRLFRETGIKPDIAVGDFDSVTPEEKASFLRDWPAEVLQPVKDDTDMERAVQLVLEKHPESVVILGATGTRLDHTLTNIRLLERFHSAGVAAEILDEHNRIRLVDGLVRLSRAKQYGKYISLLPLDAEAAVTLKGFFYPAEDLILRRASSLGVSNEIVEETAEIRTAGLILLMETKD